MPCKHLKEVAVTWLLHVDRFLCCEFDFLCRCHGASTLSTNRCVCPAALICGCKFRCLCYLSEFNGPLCYQMELPRRRVFWWETTSSLSTGLTSPASLTLRLLTWLDRVRCFIRVTLACNKVFHFSTVLVYLSLNTTHQCPKNNSDIWKNKVVFVIM